MPVSTPTLSNTIATLADCSGLTLTDSTGAYSALTNPGGYGLPGGPAVADVTTVTLRVTLNSLGTTYFQFVFTVASGVITAATLSLDGATAVNILDDLPSTAWPFTDAFSLFEDYGVTVPTFGDDVYKVDYTIAGTVTATPFEYTVTTYFPVTCIARCCINKKFADLDVNCDCSSEAVKTALYGEALIKKVTYASEYGKLSEALSALNELREICDESCGC